MTDLPLIVYVSFLVLVSSGLFLIEIVKKLERRSAQYLPGSLPEGRVLVMVPCRGHDITLSENLLSLKNQDYPSFDLVAIVDSADDVALEAIRETGITHIVSDVSCRKCSGKVRALSSAIYRFPDYDIYVIADSDATFSREWLRTLVRPLANARYGLSTTFPVFVPVGGFWSRVKMVWGFVGNSMMESRITRFGWGGSLAFRRSLIEKGNLSVFSESVSDDTALTHFSSSAGLDIAFCDGGLVTVKSRETSGSFFEWSNRQTALAISGSSRLYGLGLAYYSARLLLLLSSIALSVLVSPAALLLLLPYATGIVKIYRKSGSRDPAIIPIFLSTDVLYLANLLKAKRMTKIVWRGREYSLGSEGS